MKKIILSLSVLSCFNVIAESNSAWLDSNSEVKNKISNLLKKDVLKKRSLFLDETLLKNRLNPITKSFSTN